MWCLVMVEISYSTRREMSRALSAEIVQCHKSRTTEIYSSVSYSKISIQLTGWAKISSFDLKLLLQSLIDHKRSLQI